MTTDEIKLVENNTGLVYHLYGKLPRSDITKYYKDDLVSEGMIGLVKAAQTFDITKNIKFGTYAARCISNQMYIHIRHINKIKRKETISLDTVLNINEDGDTLRLEDTIICNNIDNVNDKLYTEELQSCYEKWCSILKPMHQKIISMKSKGYTQSKIADILHISQSCVARILKRLKIRFLRTHPDIGLGDTK